MSRKTLIYLFPTLAGIAWGIGVVGAKVIGNYGFSSIEITFLRFFMASIVFIPILIVLAIRERGKYIPSDRRVWLDILGLSITGVAANNTIFYFGLERTTSSIASLIVGIAPLSAVVFARIFLKEELTARKIIALILGISGVVFIVGLEDTGMIVGNLFIIVAVTIWGSSFVFSKRASQSGLSAIAITAWSEIVGTALLIPFVINGSVFSKFSQTTFELIWWLFFLGIVSSVFAYILYYFAVSRLGSGKISINLNLIPIAGAITAWFVFGDTLSVFAILGIILVIAGVLTIQSEQWRSPQTSIHKSKKETG